MDYSLLLGLDKAEKELVVGIVDSVGSYDLWKTIESKGKMLTRGGDVTVVCLSCALGFQDADARFRPISIRIDSKARSIDTSWYAALASSSTAILTVQACPDKWSKSAPGDTPMRPLTSFL
jgi:hypothetical protein